MTIFLLEVRVACFFALGLVLVFLDFRKAAGFGILARVQILWGRLHGA